MTYPKKDYDTYLAEVQKTVDTFPFKVFRPIIEVCLSKFGIPYTRAFPEAETMCAYNLRHNDVSFYCAVDSKAMEIVFEINAGSPKLTLPLFAYGEIFEPSSFHERYMMMLRIIDAGIYYK